MTQATRPRPLRALRSLLRRTGFDVVRWQPAAADVEAALPPDFDDAMRETWRRVAPLTQTSPERIHETCAAVEHVVRHGIEGALVECGAWRGGSSAAMALTLQRRGARRELWIYDTFEGMTEPDPVDVSFEGGSARTEWSARRAADVPWNAVGEEEVRRNVAATGYDMTAVRLVRGRVEDTIPAQVPDAIAVLRLDTDWHASTLHEMDHLFPRLARGGVLIVDDYGHWAGARRAVDEYFTRERVQMFLARTDYTGRLGIKV